jgi:hypothetical protein
MNDKVHYLRLLIDSICSVHKLQTGTYVRCRVPWITCSCKVSSMNLDFNYDLDPEFQILRELEPSILPRRLRCGS